MESFVDTSDNSFEHAAERELLEETGFIVDKNITDLRYHSSVKVHDARYKNTKDCIMTHIFICESETELLPDIDKILDLEFSEFKWIPCTQNNLDLVSSSHQPLFELFYG